MLLGVELETLGDNGDNLAAGHVWVSRSALGPRHPYHTCVQTCVCTRVSTCLQEPMGTRASAHRMHADHVLTCVHTGALQRDAHTLRATAMESPRLGSVLSPGGRAGVA